MKAKYEKEKERKKFTKNNSQHYKGFFCFVCLKDVSSVRFYSKNERERNRSEAKKSGKGEGGENILFQYFGAIIERICLFVFFRLGFFAQDRCMGFVYN